MSHSIQCIMEDPLLKYAIDETNLLGEGSFGKVYVCTSRETGDVSAIKSTNINLIDDQGIKNNIDNEAIMLSELSDPHIIHQHECFKYNNIIYQILDLAQMSLDDYLHHHRDRNELIIFRIFKQMVSATTACHQNGIVHRDIKLENFLVKNIIEGTPFVLLSDFGFATYYHQGALLYDFPGTPKYAAPELTKGIPYDGQKSDIWALGVCLYYLYFNVLPFDDEDIDEMYYKISHMNPVDPMNRRLPQSLRRKIAACPFDLRALISACLDKTPGRRPSISEIVEHPWFRRMIDLDKALVINESKFFHQVVDVLI